MNKSILQLCGIKHVNRNYSIVLTDEMEIEIKALVFLERLYKNKPFYEKCVNCYHHIEAMNDYCEIKEKKTLCFDLCDQFQKKITEEEAESMGCFEGFLS